MKNKLIIFACDTNNKTGEGNLAESIFKQLNKDFKALFYEDYITKIISRENFLEIEYYLSILFLFVYFLSLRRENNLFKFLSNMEPIFIFIKL